MHYKNICNIIDIFKYILSLLIFLFIALSFYFFIYWLLYSADVPLPSIVADFSWTILNKLSHSLVNNPNFGEIKPTLPVLACCFFVVIAYIINGIISCLDVLSQKIADNAANQRKILERKINSELKKAFIEELEVSNYVLVKFRVDAVEQTSYLSEFNNSIDVEALNKRLNTEIAESVLQTYVIKKFNNSNAIDFIISDFEHLKDFLVSLTQTSTTIINKAISSKLNVNFYCCIDLMNNISNFALTSDKLDKLLDLKIKNRIIVTPKFKIYYENIYPIDYKFVLIGEYNVLSDSGKNENTMLYTILRKN